MLVPVQPCIHASRCQRMCEAAASSAMHICHRVQKPMHCSDLQLRRFEEGRKQALDTTAFGAHRYITSHLQCFGSTFQHTFASNAATLSRKHTNARSRGNCMGWTVQRAWQAHCVVMAGVPSCVWPQECGLALALDITRRVHDVCFWTRQACTM
jgi:hypothetical protein